MKNRKHTECADDIIEKYLNRDFVLNVKPEDCATILFTSETTVRGNGGMLSYGDFIDNTFCSTEKEPQSDEVFLNVLPIHHAFCLNGDVFIVMRYGNTLCLNNSLSKMLYYIQVFQLSATRLVPMMTKVLYNKISMIAHKHLV